MVRKRWTFWAACMGMLLFGVTFITLGAVVPMLKQRFQLDDITAGTLFSILPFGILTGSLVFGPVCDKYGYKILLCVSCVCIAAGLEGIAYSSTQGLLSICIFLFGFGGGAINGATNALMSDISLNDKGANLSLLGVFFGIGALGMPVLLGSLEHRFTAQQIVATVGLLTLAAGILFIGIQFPLPKQVQGFPIARGIGLIKDKILLLIGFFLFCQSSFEAIINNWITTYLTGALSAPANKALYALSLFVVGMTIMRLLLGSVFRSFPVKKILKISFVGVLSGCILLKFGLSFPVAVSGLVLLGAGLASGFPVMLGLAGSRFADISGTAFSIILVIALSGNMLVNYIMGIIANKYGIHHLADIAFAELAAMSILGIIIINKIKINTSI